MRLKKNTLALALVLSCASGLGVAGAQDSAAGAQPGAGAEGPAEPPGTGVAAPGEPMVQPPGQNEQVGALTPPPIEVDETLTPQQQRDKGRQMISGMEQSSTTVRRQLAQARAARDVVKVICLNDKLTQIDVARGSAADRMVALDGAVQAGDATRSRHEYAVLSVLRERVVALVGEANQCIGEETDYVGEAIVTVQIDPNIPEQDPDQLGVDPQLISVAPVLVSPTE